MKSFFEDNSGGLSSNRLAFLIWTAGPFIIWAFISLMKLDIQSLPESIIGIMGMIITGKVIQRFGEKTEAAPTSTTPPPAP